MKVTFKKAASIAFALFLANSFVNSSQAQWVTTGAGNTAPLYTNGNVGIGNASPGFKLSLGGGVANTRIALYDNNAASPGDVYGLGIQAYQFRLHLNGSGQAKFTFLSDAAGSRELLNIGSYGNVTIGGPNTTNASLTVNKNNYNSLSNIDLVNGNQLLEFAIANGAANFSPFALPGDKIIRTLGGGSGTYNNLILTAENAGAAIKFGTNYIQRAIIDGNGNLGVGVTAPTQRLDVAGNANVSGFLALGGATTPNTYSASNLNGYSLYVKGGVLTEKLKIGSVERGTWADYVFDKSYKLKSLEEVERYITSNKHLPDVPSAQEVETSGIDIAKMDATLLQKIEELTLYMIEMKKENSMLKSRLDKVENLTK